jgi:sec-independent protein translocase protein TatB
VFDINGTEALVLLLLALILMGPTRLPKYAQQLGRLARKARDFARDTKGKVEGELGLQEGEIDWDALDPRKYDPRRIVQDALSDAAPPGLGLRSPRRTSPPAASTAQPHTSLPRPSQREPLGGPAPVKPPVMEEPQHYGDPV